MRTRSRRSHFCGCEPSSSPSFCWAGPAFSVVGRGRVGATGADSDARHGVAGARGAYPGRVSRAGLSMVPQVAAVEAAGVEGWWGSET